MTSVEDAVPDARVATPTDAERDRLSSSNGDLKPWRVWGPYVAGRQWGTVREDYSANGDAWNSFPFDHSHRRAYRWGEDGIAGICDRYGFLNLALALWNGQDDRLKERLFGLTNPQGNHGEDVKEFWWHLDATPTHSYAEYLYRYPQAAFPYADLVAENARRRPDEPEYELVDTGVLAQDRFFDVTVVHAKASADDVTMEIRVMNHGPDAAPLDVVPQFWFRNTWAWGRDARKPTIQPAEVLGCPALTARHEWLGEYHLIAEGRPRLLLCDNETNVERLFGVAGGGPAHPKDAIDDAIVHGDESHLAVDLGTKAAVWWHLDAVQPGETVVLRLRLVSAAALVPAGGPFDAAEITVAQRRREADLFYAQVVPEGTSEDDAFIARRAFAGLMWCKQVYRYSVRQWLDGDPAGPAPPAERRAPQPAGRNTEWKHLDLADVISMPDEWEYPWFASWDLAFHCVALSHVDSWFAKEQLALMCREWAMNPSGQLAAYEWNFSDVNPPVMAWAAFRVYQQDAVVVGAPDRPFLVRVFTKLMFNFGWWVNRKDPHGDNLFEGGFLGMDNIGVFDRSAPLPEGQRLEQSDATSWMAFFCLTMLEIAIELAELDQGWDEVATKFLEHYLAIAEAIEAFGSEGVSLWDEEDGFFYDVLVQGGVPTPVRVRSIVGLLPLLGVMTIPDFVWDRLPDFSRRLAWLRERRPEMASAVIQPHGRQERYTLSIVSLKRLTPLLNRLFDEEEFLSPHGIRALSAAYRSGATIELPGRDAVQINYKPAESDDGLFGGNSNWRGPVWIPVNALVLHALRVYGGGFAEELAVDYPVRSNNIGPLSAAADDLEQRLIGLFRIGPDGRRPGDPPHVPTGPLWQAHPTFSEYFNGDDGSGLGASHQTGWTAMIAHLICNREAYAEGVNPKEDKPLER